MRSQAVDQALDSLVRAFRSAFDLSFGADDRVTRARLEQFKSTQPARLALTILRWWDIKREEGQYSESECPRRVLTDLGHSALLPWMLAGNEPLPVPPPISFSRPWHQLVVDGYGEALEAWQENSAFLIINHARWCLREVLGDGVWIASPRASSDDRWIVVRVPDADWKNRSFLRRIEAGSEAI